MPAGQPVCQIEACQLWTEKSIPFCRGHVMQVVRFLAGCPVTSLLDWPEDLWRQGYVVGPVSGLPGVAAAFCRLARANVSVDLLMADRTPEG